MKIVYAASEAAPYIKTGGLADVMQALPNIISRQRECETALFLPLYGKIKRDAAYHMELVGEFNIHLGWRTQYVGLFRLMTRSKKRQVYFIDNEFYFDRSRIYGEDDDGERFVYFSRAVLAAITYLQLEPDIIHCNDWQTAPICVLMRTEFEEQFRQTRSIFTIHNVEYQGWAGADFFDDVFALPSQYRGVLEKDGSVNLMKGAVLMADRITTVSVTYAQELHYAYFGHGMEPYLSARDADLSGIVNGIDPTVFDPATDKLLPQCYDAQTMVEGKRVCKQMLQQEVGLPQRPEVPVLAMVTRLAGHKGIDLLCYLLPSLMQRDLQIVIVGTGEARFEQALRDAMERYPERIAAILRYDGQLANRIYAGSDLYLMPSQSEPCGLSQLIAMHYGTVPVVHSTGGLRDTVTPYNPETKQGRGFTFQSYNGEDFLAAIDRATTLFRDDRDAWNALAQADMLEDFSWKTPAKAYLALYRNLCRAE